MEDGGFERGGGEPCLQRDEGDGAGLNGLILLLLTARPALPTPGDEAARGEPPETGGGPRGGLARSLQKAEAMLRSCVTPGLRRLLPPRPRRRGEGDEEEDEDEEEETPALVSGLEQSFAGLRRCLYVWEDPRTETFQGHVRPPPGDAAISHHGVRPPVSRRGAALHALLRHRHLLRLARDYARRIKAASDFLRRLLRAPRAGPPEPLRGLCQELRAHAGHWGGLRRRMRGDPWLRPLLLWRHQAVSGMRRSLLALALLATRLAERVAEGRLRVLATAGPPAAPLSPPLLADLFQGLEIYNQVVGDLAQELSAAGMAGATGDSPRAFPLGRVLGVLGTQRGRVAAERLRPLLRPRDGDPGAEDACWEDTAVPWPPECGGPSGGEGPSGIAAELRALCREDEELMGLVLGGLVASADSLWHPELRWPRQQPGERPDSPGAAGWKSVRWLDAARAPAAEALGARYRLLFWEATGTALGHRLELAHGGTGTVVTAARDLSHALAQAPVPREGQEELGRLCLRLLCRSALRSWDRDFSRALGSALTDKCLGEPGVSQPGVLACSRTAQLLQCLFPALAFALHCLRTLGAPSPPGQPPGTPDLRLQVLGCCLASAQAAGSWLRVRAGRYLAAWALPQFLLVTQGDLPLLRTKTEELVLLVSGTFRGAGDPPQLLTRNPLAYCEQQLYQQLRATATGIQLLSGDVLRMFSTSCKRISAEIFDQTMPQGKHWRLGLRPDLPSSPSAYAAAAAQAVVGQVLQGARLLPREAQATTLARVTTAFLEAWMDHILEQRIKFSLQGALQLRQDFELVRELVGSERYGLDPETRRTLLALRVFQQMDGAILCLLQQPGGAAGTAPRPWNTLRHCCSDTNPPPPELAAGSLDGLETLDPPRTPPLPMGTGLAVPPSYLSAHQQQWLSLRLHRARRWRVPGLPCVRNGHDA
ncbi:coiled-coil domain-containing protein 142 [Heliangelus exortis]|uniref:coiled-coil domain-containing protein 142 n=1 Tax=Heliangelus exortis TaxID=472823 RepID=UPI003A8CF1D0